MFNQIHTSKNLGSSDQVSTGTRRLRLFGSALAVGMVVLAGCGGASDTRAVPTTPESRSVSEALSDPGPVHLPDYGRLTEILMPRTATKSVVAPVEFGGMAAPVGEPNWRARRTQVVPVEFGGMVAPVGSPMWDALRAQPLPVEFGGMPAPIGEPIVVPSAGPDHQVTDGPH